MSAAMALHVALSMRLDATEAYRLAHAYRDEVLAKYGATPAGQNCLQHALLFALNWHGTIPAELHAGINKILTADETAADFFQPDRTYRYTNSHGDTWEFRVVAIDRDPNNTLQAIGWLSRAGTDIWHASCRGTDGWVSEGWTAVEGGA